MVAALRQTYMSLESNIFDDMNKCSVYLFNVCITNILQEVGLVWTRN